MRNWKIIVVFFLFIGYVIFLFSQLYSLQIKKGDYYGALALGQQISFEEVPGQRGEIFFNGKTEPLAQTKKKNIIYIFPGKIEDKEKIAEFLNGILSEEKGELLALLEKGEIIKREISDKDMEKIKKEDLPGIYPDQILGRVYPYGTLASHLIGFTNQEGEGQYGLEGYYNNLLQGKDSFWQKERSPLGYLALFSDSRAENFKGGEIYLTLDYNIQYFSEKVLQSAKEKWDIDSGQIIVLEPSTGKIIALANFPSFDPNKYGEEENLEIFLNGAIQKLFEPGSVFKPITFAAGLQEEEITPQTEYEDKGFVEVGGPPIYNFEKRIWKKQSMTDVLEESINTGAVFVQQKLGKERFLNYLEKFGFFELTNIDLQGEEFSKNETLRNGYPRDFATASFGQGIQLNALQLAMAFGAIANGGKLMKPYIVEKIIQSDGEELETKPTFQREVISETISSRLTSMLVSVVENGSGRRAKIGGYFIAGKTGTAQVPLEEGGYSEEKTIHSFVGFFPALNPKVLILIKLDNPKGVKTAEYSAVPLFRDLAKYIIDFWEIPPSYE